MPSAHLLRFFTAGSVDDGKSTLIGRLLYEAKGVYEDQMTAVRKSGLNRSSGDFDFSLLTDGLRAEREQGITIDVAYRYFATARRKFIIADTPGHEQYTRNMATGASTAELAIILIDARKGVLPQSRRHAFISSLLGIRHAVVAVNKMDLVDFREEIFRSIEAEFAAFARETNLRDIVYYPISALDGDNIVEKSPRTPWFTGAPLLEYLETVEIAGQDSGQLRFPVQYVVRPTLDFRGYAGQVASGAIKPGDAVMALPSGRIAKVAALPSFDGDLAEARPSQSVTVVLDQEIDLSRGDMLVDPRRRPSVARRLRAMLVWMHPNAGETGKMYLLKHTTQLVQAEIRSIDYRVNVDTMGHTPAERLELNEIASVTVETKRPLFCDPYLENRTTGAFILIDPISNATVAAGMIGETLPEGGGLAALAEVAANGVPEAAVRVTPGERLSRIGHFPATIWLSGRPELAYRIERALFDLGCQVAVLPESENAGHFQAEARTLKRAGMIAICSLDKENEAERKAVMDTVGGSFIELDHAGLSANDDLAAVRVVELLEAHGVLRRG
ncbi:MAG: sulfate adenylyltransferase subunit CysN [Bryobacteraceae bacterium]|nr:sulfate adenylyltransferase subunit CysN [Bryobacteraceae bacterium]